MKMTMRSFLMAIIALCVVVVPQATLGSEYSEIRGIVMRNCRKEGAGAMLYLKMRTDTPQHYSDVLVENVTSKRGDFVRVGAWTQYADLGGRSPRELKSYATNVVIRNWRGTCRTVRNIRENSEVFEMEGLKHD